MCFQNAVLTRMFDWNVCLKDLELQDLRLQARSKAIAFSFNRLFEEGILQVIRQLLGSTIIRMFWGRLNYPKFSGPRGAPTSKNLSL